MNELWWIFCLLARIRLLQLCFMSPILLVTHWDSHLVQKAKACAYWTIGPEFYCWCYHEAAGYYVVQWTLINYFRFVSIIGCCQHIYDNRVPLSETWGMKTEGFLSCWIGYVTPPKQHKPRKQKSPSAGMTASRWGLLLANLCSVKQTLGDHVFVVLHMGDGRWGLNHINGALWSPYLEQAREVKSSPAIYLKISNQFTILH